jgi:SAM-dependent methyltransferase
MRRKTNRLPDVSRASTNRVAGHYERWPFPGEDFLSKEGLVLLRHLKGWLKEDRQGNQKPARVADIGCGTGNTLIALARYFQDVHFVGIDLSKTAIDIALAHALEEGIKNVTFRQADITKGLSKFGSFSIVLSLGVLHHMERLASAFRKLVQLTKEGGYLVLWLYGSHGRMKHQLNQFLIELLARPSERLLVAQTFLKDLGPRFAIDTGFYTPKGSGEEGRQWLLRRPHWLADQMIPAFERSVTMKEILGLFQENHLQFVNWLGVPTHLSSYTSSRLLIRCFEKLSLQEQLMAIDYLIKPEYYFVVGRGRMPNPARGKKGED